MANDPRLVAALERIPAEERLHALQDAVHAINGYEPAALNSGMGRRLTNEQVREYIATEGHAPKILPDVIIAPNAALVREIDRSGYFKLVQEHGSWFCGCGESQCIHRAVLREKLELRGEA